MMNDVYCDLYGETTLGRSRRRWQENVKLNYKNLRCGREDKLSSERVSWNEMMFVSVNWTLKAFCSFAKIMNISVGVFGLSTRKSLPTSGSVCG
jgi:hypothetical protein